MMSFQGGLNLQPIITIYAIKTFMVFLIFYFKNMLLSKKTLINNRRGKGRKGSFLGMDTSSKLFSSRPAFASSIAL